jgi:hypothetical protein
MADMKIHADHTTSKHLGHWTTDRRHEVRVRRGIAVLDLRSSRIPPGDLEVHLDVAHGLVKLLLPNNAPVDQWDLQWTGRGRVKDWKAAAAGGRQVRLTGTVRDSEIRIHRGGVAILSAMCSRAYLDDLRRSRRINGTPTVDDPSRP